MNVAGPCARVCSLSPAILAVPDLLSPDPFRVSFVVPVRNKRAYGEQCLGSVVEMVRRTPHSELFLVDNGSTDGSLEFCQSLAGDRIRVLEVAGTIAAVRNAGAAEAKGDWLYFIDSDCVVPPNLVERLAGVLRNPEVDATGCAVEYPLDRSWVERTWSLMHRRRSDGPRSYLNSGNLVVRRSAFERISGFSPGMVTGEDAELGQRLCEAGYRIAEHRALAVTHLDNPQTLAAFYRKEVWHGLGARDARGKIRFDRPTALAVLHVLLLAAIPVAALMPFPLDAKVVIGAGLFTAVPAFAVAARFQQTRRSFGFLAGAALYWVYLVARVVALFAKRTR